MLKLISYMPNNSSLEEFNRVKKELFDLEIDGIETVLGDYCNEEVYNNLPIKGVHLIYFPTWLDIWYENKKNLQEDFNTHEPYGIESKEDFINIYHEQFKLAKEFNAKYMVLHISHVRPRDIFTLKYQYTDQEILQATLELVNTVFQGDGPKLLFENLPWPGFNLKEEKLFLNFLEKVQYKNKGIMLDFSHLMCFNTEISTYCEGANFIKNQLNKVPQLKKYICGIHLNGSLSKEYLSQDFSLYLQEWLQAETMDRYKIEISHIKNIDTHDIFNSHKISEIISELNPEFLVYELAYKSLEELIHRVKIQNNFLNFR